MDDQTGRTAPHGPSHNAIAETVAQLTPWFHNLHLPDGTQTAPDHFLGDFPRYKWEELVPFLPHRLDQWSVLDLGCNAGYYSIELAKLGARVTAVEINPHYLGQARWAAELFGVAERIDFRCMQIYDLARVEGQFDLVLFLGVFYHLRYPLLGLDIVAEKVKRMLFFQTLTMPGPSVCMAENLGIDERQLMLSEGWPKMAFIENSLADDPTNWWAPNHAAVLAMLRSTGLEVIARPGTEVYLCEPQRTPAPSAGWDRIELLAATGRPHGEP